jgi:hypothetical protein
METQAKRNAIADEAVGQRHEGAPPKTRQQDHDPSPEEVARRLAVSTGAQASISEKTAESIGERVANAYSDPDLARRPVSIGRGSARRISAPFELQHLLTLGTGFVLGYTAAVLLHSRIGTYFGRTPEPFQISKPPQGDRHPRRFVQSTVLKAITEHLQGMTAAEIIRELGYQGIGQQPIEDALGALVQAKKVSVRGGDGKYIPAAEEVPTAPDQPST